MSNFTTEQIRNAEAAQRKHLVPASVTLAQFAIESSYGRYMPSGSNNPFGIKEFGGGPKVITKTREVIHGRSFVVDQPFRKFTSLEEAFDHHASMLATLGIYKPAMEAWTHPPYSLEAGIRLMAAHYATAPDYATTLLTLIYTQNLQRYDREAT